MVRKTILKAASAMLCVVSAYAFPKTFAVKSDSREIDYVKSGKFIAQYSYNLDPLIVINQNTNEKGLVVIEGKLTKPFMNDHVKLSIKYQNAQGDWVTGWCKMLYSYNQYNETLKAAFELPASSAGFYNLKIELSSDTNLNNFSSVVWDKTVKHYKLGDYAAADCDLDENEYTILLTPKKSGTLLLDGNGNVTGVKDRVTSAYSWNKLNNVLMNNKKDDVVFSPKNPATLINDNGIKSVKMQGVISDTLGSTPQTIYNAGTGHPIPYLYSYDDPVYMFAGKFSINGFLMKFSQWPGEPNGPGYHDFKNPNLLESRYFNLYNTISKKLSDFISDQEPVVIVSSITTGFRVYKSNGAFIDLTPHTTSNYGGPYFGYTNDQGGARRGPGSENFSIANTTEMTLYGMGALRNSIQANYQAIRTMPDIEKEISKFIKYTGVFGASTAYDDTSECSIGCFAVNPGATPDSQDKDWTKAPNSYIFDPNKSYSGLYIPVKKAYAMWEKDKFIGGTSIPDGAITADVLWEDEHGLIKSGANYALEIVGSKENAKIKVPINKAKKGNAVIAFKVNGEIYWSWHVWVTDEPYNGSTYKSFTGLKREKNDGTVELIPDSDWGWMDRNLGAVGNSITGPGWTRNGGLLYQWGRKDPIPPLAAKGNDLYEVSGSIGRVRHNDAKFTTNSTNFNSLRKFVLLSNALVTNNIKLSVKNPLSLIYVNKNDNSGPAYYNEANLSTMVNWFGKSSTLSDNRLTELNLWSDNSQGRIYEDYQSDEQAQPYRNKSSYDPCPNGWRIPSALVAVEASPSQVDDVRIDFSPFGVRTNMKKNVFETNNYQIIQPTDGNTPDFRKGIKLYTNVGFDLTNVGGFNMGIFPGTGQLLRTKHNGQYTDQHHTALWTATMIRQFDGTPAVGARALFLLPDKGQPDIPDSNYPNINGRYMYEPLSKGETSGAGGCRCIKDPLFVVNEYDFQTDFYSDGTEEYTVGLDNPNSYQVVKSAVGPTISIPVSKAFSVQSSLLNNPAILNLSNFNNLKVNVLWADKNGLITNATLSNPAPTSLSDLSSTNIIIKVAPNLSGNAVVTLHNGSITNPVYWSWHIWVTDTEIGSKPYTTELPDSNATNYINYVKKGDILQTDFMDRNLGAANTFPTIAADPLNPTSNELLQIRASAGLHYQWGRKDPLPIFQNADNRGSFDIYLGNVADNGTITYTALTAANYNNLSGSYIIPYDTYTNSTNANVLSTDKISDKISKVLSYSVRNPLVYMVPSQTAAYNGGYTAGTDWLSAPTEPNLAADRWGRGGKKSPFDPCPEGWRIPDLTGVLIEANLDFGITPWYKKDLNVASPYNLTIYHGGKRVRRSSTYSYTIGFTMNDPAFPVGNYPVSGSRGFRSVTGGTPTTNTFNTINYQYTGIWTGALVSNYLGRPINMLLDSYISGSNTSLQSRIFSFHDNNDPYFGMNCRCVRVKNDNGVEMGPIPKLQVTTTSMGKATNVLTKTIIEEKITNKKIDVFPNPVKNILYIQADEAKEYYYQIYNMSGQLVKSGKFENKQTDLSSLTAGVYLIRINNSESIVKIIKE